MSNQVNDILLNDQLDLLIENGDFVVDVADEQIQELILLASKGSFRESPLTGVGIVSYLKSRLSPALVDKLRQTINLQMQYDGFSSSSVTIEGTTQIDNIDITTTR
jgi:hypothetical protein